MQLSSEEKSQFFVGAMVLLALILTGTVAGTGYYFANRPKSETKLAEESPDGSPAIAPLNYLPRDRELDTSGFLTIGRMVEPWQPTASALEIQNAFVSVGPRLIKELEESLTNESMGNGQRISVLMTKSIWFNYEGDPLSAYEALTEARRIAEGDKDLAQQSLFSIIFLQGLTSLRRGENENCIMCRGESSCILPISAAAVHTNPEGSRAAITHFTEYLDQFPDDLEVRWLLNLAHMTLGEYPDNVNSRYRLALEHYNSPKYDIGRFRDVGSLVGLNHFNMAGAGIMDDFNNDHLLDVLISSIDFKGPVKLFLNNGQGQFEDQSPKNLQLEKEVGAINCVQTDYDNDGYMDIWVMRGGWFPYPIRCSLLRNNGDATFTDVTEEAGLAEPLNTMASAWADYDNDGWLDLFVCCEQQPSRLYRNLGNGKFANVSEKVGIEQFRKRAKGVTWIDYDNDGYQDLFVNYLTHDEGAQLFHNERDGTFRDVTLAKKIAGPVIGFSCWSWDFDNDGWLDIFATCYEQSTEDVVRGLMGRPHLRETSRLYRNFEGRGFEDVSSKAGLDKIFATMGSNFGDFDNDGFLDMYLGTGKPAYNALVPNRMFKNVGGKTFAEITASSGTGNLQKGHGIACGDWDCDGDVDIFAQMGGAVPGDQYHNILFQNPGHGNHWLTVKLIGQKSNRAAIGARIKVITGGENAQTIHRHISSGSSFGGNPMQQTIGLGKSDRIVELEIHWPTTNTTQVFRDVRVDQAIEITEFAESFEPIKLPAIKVVEAT